MIGIRRRRRWRALPFSHSLSGFDDGFFDGVVFFWDREAGDWLVEDEGLGVWGVRFYSRGVSEDMCWDTGDLVFDVVWEEEFSFLRLFGFAKFFGFDFGEFGREVVDDDFVGIEWRFDVEDHGLIGQSGGGRSTMKVRCWWRGVSEISVR
jgi:hypothetical protein